MGIVYDSGNYVAALDKLLEHIDPAEVRREAEGLRAKGIYRGIGFSTYTEICGNAPSRAVGPERVSACRAAAGSRPRSVSTPAARSRCTRAPRPTARATRPALPRSSPTGSGIDPSMVEVIHGDTDTGPWGLDTYGSRSLAVGGEAAARTAKKVADKAKADRRPPARSRSRGHRAARRQVLRSRLTRPRDDARRGGGRRVHPREPARGHGARARRADVLRPRELRVPVRRARLRRRRRCRDRQDQGRPLRRGRRLRAGDQPAADRRPGARRHHARHRAGAVRAHRVRRVRAAGHRDVRRLCAADCGGAAELRDRPHRDAVAGQHARRQGRRRGRHDRRNPGRHSTPCSTRSGRSESRSSTCRSARCGSGRQSKKPRERQVRQHDPRRIRLRGRQGRWTRRSRCSWTAARMPSCSPAGTP